MSACSRTPDLRSRSNPSNRSNGQMPTCTTPIRASAPWRTAADSIRARTACSSMGLSNSAARLATSAVAIAPSHHRRLRVRNVNIDARMPQPDRAPAVGRLRKFCRRPSTSSPRAELRRKPEFGRCLRGVAQCQEPRRANQRGGAGARSDLQALAAVSGHSCARVYPTNADPEQKSERMSEHIHVRITRAQQGQQTDPGDQRVPTGTSAAREASAVAATPIRRAAPGPRTRRWKRPPRDARPAR